MNTSTQRPALLTVLAHPDDESFGTGGTLALYSQRGIATHLICATGGEEGTIDPHYLEGYASAEERRRAELDCAVQALGLTSLTMLGYRDSGMPGAPANTHPNALAAQPVEAVAAQLTSHIRRLRPQVVITFDPIGGYRHPDHIAIQQATVMAFHAAGDAERFPDGQEPYAPQKLYFTTFSRAFLRLAVRLLPLFGRDPRRFGRNHDVDLTSLVTEDFPTHARIDILSAFAARTTASACHASQGGAATLLTGILSRLLVLFGGHENYMRAYPEAPIGLRERDLFEGVVW
jgi:LmbE family N-acetylglucosaminyl deacetylase